MGAAIERWRADLAAASRSLRCAATSPTGCEQADQDEPHAFRPTAERFSTSKQVRMCDVSGMPQQSPISYFRSLVCSSPVHLPIAIATPFPLPLRLRERGKV